MPENNLGLQQEDNCNRSNCASDHAEDIRGGDWPMVLREDKVEIGKGLV